MNANHLAIAVALALATGCDAPASSRAEAALAAADCERVSLAWGAGDSQVGLSPSGEEVARRGPPAVAVGPSGQLLVLDSVNRRLLEVKGDRAVAIAAVPLDADDLAIGPDGALVVLSSTRRVAWLLDADGAAAGEVAIPGAVRAVTGVHLGSSRQVSVRTALQETVPLGSPAAPRALQSSMAGTREGGFALADGRGLAVAVHGKAAVLLVVSEGHWATATARLAISGVTDGANIIGAVDGIACLRLERVEQPGAAIEVSRRALCIDVATGKTVAERPLPTPSIYVPRQELAFGGSPPSLVSLQPTPAGLVVEICEVPR